MRAGDGAGAAGAPPRAPAAGEPRRPGRPRSAEAHRSILMAALTMLAEHGVAGLTMEGVAAAAGVGKTTIYRRWPSKTELIADALSQLRPPGEPEDTGSLGGDLGAIVGVQRRRLAGNPIIRVVPRVLGEAMDDPELHRLVLERAVLPIRSMVTTIVERAVERGELERDLDVEALVDILHAVPVYLVLLSRGDPEAIGPVPDRYLPLLLGGVSSSSAGRGSARPRS